MIKEIGNFIHRNDSALALDLLGRLVYDESSSDHLYRVNSPGGSTTAGQQDIWQLDWVASLIESNPRNVMKIASEASSKNPRPITQAMAQWLKIDTRSAQDWLHHQPPGKRRDQLTGTTINYLLAKPTLHADVLSISDQMSDPQLKEEALSRIVNDWFQEDESGLEEYFQKNKVTPEQMEAFENKGYN